jgi:hypothetical protein
MKKKKENHRFISWQEPPMNDFSTVATRSISILSSKFALYASTKPFSLADSFGSCLFQMPVLHVSKKQRY